MTGSSSGLIELDVALRKGLEEGLQQSAKSWPGRWPTAFVHLGKSDDVDTKNGSVSDGFPLFDFTLGLRFHI